jgi:hypothetical protein
MSEWISEYHEGCYIDSKDTMNTWCIGKVLSINKDAKLIRIRYDGWSEKWDSTFPFNSNRIGPFRKKSELYTGQKGTAIRDWTFSIPEISQATEKLQNLPNSAFGITQFLRGELFTLVDCLLVYDYKQSLDLEVAIDFFTKVIEYIVIWIKMSKDLFPCYYDSISNPDLFLTNPKAALASAWPELIFTLKRLFGFDLRTSKKFFAIYHMPETYEFGLDTINKSTTISYFINYFAFLGGFSAILEILDENE